MPDSCACERWKYANIPRPLSMMSALEKKVKYSGVAGGHSSPGAAHLWLFFPIVCAGRREIESERYIIVAKSACARTRWFPLVTCLKLRLSPGPGGPSLCPSCPGRQLPFEHI
jgi:hypothetical protein